MGSKNVLYASINAIRHRMARNLLPLLLLMFIIVVFYMNYNHVNQLFMSVSMSSNDKKRASLDLTNVHQAFASCNNTLINCHTYKNIKEVHNQNRCLLNHIDIMPSKTDFDRSVFHYGVPDHVEHKVMKDAGRPINLSDMVSYILTRFGPHSNYMEIGVSVGKNLFQVLTINCQDNIVAFDIEKINPGFENLMKPILVRSSAEEIIVGHKFPSLEYGSPKHDDCTLNTYHEKILRDNNFFYINCDEFDQAGWNRMEQLVSTLPSQSFQVIFSDALHTVEAINFELDHVFQHNLLNKHHFAYVWDDMGDKVSPFCERIVNYASPTVRNNVTCVVGHLPGWFGVHEYKHSIAIITTLDIRDVISKHISHVQYIREPYSL